MGFRRLAASTSFRRTVVVAVLALAIAGAAFAATGGPNAPIGTMGINGGESWTTTSSVTIDSTMTGAAEMRIGPPLRLIRAASGFTAALSDDGELWTWGYNSAGQLGLGDNVTRKEPTRVSAGTTWTVLATGNNSAAAIRADGTLMTWGQNNSGQLGTADYLNRSVPTTVSGGGTWKAVAISDTHTLAIKTNGTLWSWGDNGYGQLGSGSTRSVPQQVGTDSDWTYVYAKGGSSFAIKGAGVLMVCGQNNYGRLGLGDTNLRGTFTQVTPGQTYKMVASNYYTTQFLRTNGTLWSSGYVYTGLGTGGTYLSPQQVNVGSTYREVAADYVSSLAVRTDGTLWGWGDNGYYQLGIPGQSARLSPVQVGSSTGWVNPDTGLVTSYGFRNGELYVWGRADDYKTGRLEAATPANYTAPVSLTTTWQPYQPSVSWNIGTADDTHTVWASYRESGGDVRETSDTIYLDLTGPSGTMQLNGGQPSSAELTVSVGSSITNVSEMNIDSQGWVPYADTTATALSGPDGTKTVTVEYRDEYGRVLSRSDSIDVDTSGPTGTMTINNDAASTRFRKVSVTSNVPGAVSMQPAGRLGWTDFALGNTSSGGIRTDGSLWSAGNNGSGDIGNGTSGPLYYFTRPNDGGATWQSMSKGISGVTYGVKTDGSLWAWGANSSYELGQGATQVPSYVPVRIGLESTWKSVKAGWNFGVAMKTDGSLWAWGSNGYGQLGDGSQATRFTPVRCGLATDYFTNYAPGYYHVLATKSDKTLWAWGYNAYGQLGNGSVGGNVLSPTRANADPHFVSLAGGNMLSAAVKDDGSLWTWGYSGYLSDGTEVTRGTPGRVGSDTNWKSVAVGQTHGIALKTDGSAYGWGANNNGMLGDWTTTQRLGLTRVGLRSDFATVAAGAYSSAAISTDGTLWVWGGNGGEFGDGTTTMSLSPTRGDWIPYSTPYPDLLSAGNGTKSLTYRYRDSAGNISDMSDSILLDSTIATGTLVANGGASYAGSTTVQADSAVSWAQDMRFVAPATMVSAGTSGTLTIGQDGVAYASGRGAYGRFGNGGTADYATPIVAGSSRGWTAASVGDDHALWLKGNSLYSSGLNSYGQLGLNSKVNTSTAAFVGTGYTVVSAGNTFSSAITTGGALHTWGRNDKGQLGYTGVVEQLTPRLVDAGPWTAVSASTDFAVGIKGGRLYAWGNNTSGQLGTNNTTSYSVPTVVATTTTNWVAVSAGVDHVLARNSLGQLYAWGNSSNGQLGTGSYSMYTTPQLVGSSYSAISAGNKFSMALKTNGTLWTWGKNDKGQRGAAIFYEASLPSRTSVETDWVGIDAGYSHAAGIKADGTTWAWGDNVGGPLGDTTTVNHTSPAMMQESPWVAYAAAKSVTMPYASGTVTLYGQYRDFAGNVVGLSDSIAIDVTAPVTGVTGAPAGWTATKPTVLTLTPVDTGGSGLATTYYAINGGASQTGTSVSVSGEGTNTISYRSIDYAGNSETSKTVSVRIDTTKPVTTSSISGGWMTTSTVTLGATDVGSGVATTYYKIGAAANQTYSGQFSVPEGTTTVKYWTVDAVGNSETTVTVTAKIDLGPPTSSSSALPGDWANAPVNVTLSGADAGSGLLGMRYRIDGVEASYTAPFDITDGDHAFEWWALDVAGNREATHVAQVRVDSGPPVTDSNITGAWQTATHVSLTPTDTGSGVATTYYQVDGGAMEAYSAPFALAEGEHSVAYWSVDNSGYSETTTTVAAKFDAFEPGVTLTPSAVGDLYGWYGHDVSVSIAATDSGSGLDYFEYRLNGGAAQPYTDPLSLTNGTWSVQVTARDNAGKYTYVNDTYQIDTVGPVTTTNVDGSWTGDPVAWFTKIDPGVGSLATYYRVDGGPTQLYSGFLAMPLGVSSLEYWSVDQLGNAEETRTVTSRVDLAAPSTTASGLTGGWSGDDVTVTLDATDDASGIEATYYTIDGGATQTYAGPFVVSGSGQHALRYWSVDWFGRTEAFHDTTVKVDVTDPTTSSNVDSLWHSGTVVVSLTGQDTHSGLASTRYRFDGDAEGTSRAYGGPFAVSSSGETTVTYWSQDNVGNRETTRTAVVKIDQTPPTTQVSGIPADASFTPVTVTLTGVDPQSGVESTWYKIDGGTATKFTAPFTVSKEGDTSITYWSVDKLGFTEAEKTATVSISFGEMQINGGYDYSRSSVVTLTSNVPTAVEMRIKAPVKTIAAGARTLYVLDKTSLLMTAGDNTTAQLGSSTYGGADSANPVKADYRFFDGIAAGADFFFGWSPRNGSYGGELYGLGNNNFSQTGLGAASWGGIIGPSGYPRSSGWNTLAAAGGRDHGAYVDIWGRLYTSGNNDFGELGRAAVPEGYYTMESVPYGYSPQTGNDLWSGSVTAGDSYTMAIRRSGKLFAWGRNDRGQLGVGSTDATGGPTQVGTDSNWQSVFAGDSHSLGIKTDGSLWAWGSNSNGELGIDSTDDQLSPVLVDAGPWKTADAGQGFTLAIKSDGTLWSWGRNDLGQLGVGSYTESHVPVQVGSLADWDMIAAGDEFGAGLRTDHSLYTWGNNANGQLGNGTHTGQDAPGEIMATPWQPYAAEVTATVPYAADGTWGDVWVEYKATAGGVGFLHDTVLFDYMPSWQYLDEVPTSWVNTSPAITYDLNDYTTGSGPMLKWYTINGGDPIYIPAVNNSVINVFPEGDNTLRIGAIDKAGNVSSGTFWFWYAGSGSSQQANAVPVRCDYTIPTVASNIVDGGWQRSNLVTLMPGDALSGIQTTYYQIDSGDWKTYTGPFGVPNPDSTVAYYTLDKAGNVSALHTEQMHWDQEAPVTLASEVPEWSPVDAYVTLTSEDSRSGVSQIRYSVDDGPFIEYTEPILFDTSGVHTLTYSAEDNVGNVEVPNTDTIYIDKTDPTSAAAWSGPSYNGSWARDSATLEIEATDEHSGVANSFYRIAGGASETVTSPITLTDEGVTDVEYWSADAVGNDEDRNAIQVRIDKTDPVTEIHGVPSQVATEEVGLSLSATDAGSGVRDTFYIVDGGKTERWSSDQTKFTIAKEGTTTIEYWSSDAVDNDEAHQQATVRISYRNEVSSSSKSPACLGCHSAATGPRRVRLDFSVGKVDRTSACPKCHVDSLAGTHPYHNTASDCGSFCHPGWGASMLTAVPSVSTTAGAFAGVGSKDVGSDQLHVIHSGARWPANVDASFSRCASCHAVAACEACHDSSSDPVADTHAVHSSVGDEYYPAQTPAWTGVVGNGVVGGDQTQLTAAYVAKQCGTAKCHNTSGLQTTEPILREDYTHAGYPASNTPPNTVTSTGTWSNVYSNAYTFGRASTAGIANATRGITFSGQKVALVSERGTNRGKIDVSVDGVVKATIDCYAATKQQQVVVWESETLPPGTHTFSVKVRGQRNALSTSNYVIVDQFKVWESLPGATAPFCTDCHADRTAEHGYNDADHVADVGSQVDPAADASCDSCHSMDVLTEHERTGSVSKGRQCETCHASPRKSFAAWNQTCQQGGCHAPYTSVAKHAQMDAKHVAPQPVFDAEKQSCYRNCHEENLATEHMRAEHEDPVTCVECHNSPQFDAIRATPAGWDGRCVTCHPAPHVETTTSGNKLCFDCHGSSDSTMTALSGATAYASTGGDHETGFADSAHGPARVSAGNNGGVSTEATCEACHNKAASPQQGLLDYRTSSTKSADSALCTECHSDSAGSETLSPGSTPYNWAGRDLEVERSRTSSHGRVECASCHNVHVVGTGGSGAWDMDRVSDPANTKQRWTGTSTEFCLSCHTSTVVSASRSANSVVPYDIGFRAFSADRFFAGWSMTEPGTAFTDSGHFTTSGTKALCENCHDPHGSDNQSLTAWTRPAGFTGGQEGTRDNTSTAAAEENLCLRCHGDGTIGERADGAQIVTMTVSETYRHNTGSGGSHTFDESKESLAVDRHAECSDCHNPHAAQPGAHVPGAAGAAAALRGATGVTPSFSAVAWGDPTSYTNTQLTGQPGESEALVCFKCHAEGRDVTAARSDGTTYTSTNIAREFNPVNASYHNVFGLSTGMKTAFNFGNGARTWLLSNPELIFKSGWDQNSAVTCSDCHTSGTAGGRASGPHGSSAQWMLDPEYDGDYQTATLRQDNPDGVDQKIICVKCHANFAAMNRAHNAPSYWGGTALVHAGDRCVTCHVRIPHGWKRPRLLGYPTDPAPYRAGDVKPWGVTWGVNAIRDTSKSQFGWQAPDCQANCSSTHRDNYNPANVPIP